MNDLVEKVKNECARALLASPYTKELKPFMTPGYDPEESDILFTSVVMLRITIQDTIHSFREMLRD